jgi:hypothetical protein
MDEIQESNKGIVLSKLGGAKFRKMNETQESNTDLSEPNQLLWPYDLWTVWCQSEQINGYKYE